MLIHPTTITCLYTQQQSHAYTPSNNHILIFFCLQMSSSGSVTSSRACCENGRPIMTDPHTGQTICSCQYGTALLNYSRVQGLPEGVYGSSAAAYAAQAAQAAQGYVPLGTEGSAFYAPLVSQTWYSWLQFKIRMWLSNMSHWLRVWYRVYIYFTCPLGCEVHKH